MPILYVGIWDLGNTLQMLVKETLYRAKKSAAPFPITCSYTYNLYAKSILCPIQGKSKVR